MQTDLASAFIDTTRSFLQQYLNGIKVCFETLGEEEIWWRPNEESNSVGNLMLHVNGSLRHWILSGIGGEESHRVRQHEFDERTHIPKDRLLSNLSGTIQEIDGLLQKLDASRLLEKVELFGEEHTWMFAIYHMVEHFSMHSGQIMLITKLKTGSGLGLQ